MQQRPLSVSIIAWIIIVFSALGLLGTPLNWNNQLARDMMAGSPVPFETQIIIGAISAVISLACGIAMLKGRDWGRVVYIGVALLGLLLGLFTSPVKSMLLISVILIALVAFFLFRRPANEFFGKSYFGGTANDPANN